MTGSRVKAFLSACALAALLVPAGAQWSTDKPPVLSPDDYPPEATDDPPDQSQTPQPPDAGQPANPDSANGAPRSLQAPETAPLPPPVPLAMPAPVEVGALGKPEGAPVGTLDASNGGFGESVWSGSERARTEDLLQHAPSASPDPVLRDLARRLLLTRASAPPGSAPKAFLSVRLQRLLGAGFTEEAGAIAAQASLPDDAEFIRLQADAILLANRAHDACGPATAARQNAGDVFWMQLRAWCAASSGDTATADLTRQVLKAQGHDDAAYDALVQAVLSRTAPPALTIERPTPMHIFLLQQADLPVPESIARKMGTPENLMVVRDGRNPPRDRFEAAERVVLTGALSPALMRQVADAQDLPMNKIANAAADAPSLPFFMGQVLLRRAAAIEPRPQAKAKLIEQALALGEKFKAAPIAAAMQADIIATIKPGTVDPAFARTFARALVLSQRPTAAGAWTKGDPVMRAVVALASQDPAKMGAVQSDLSAFAAGLAKNPADPDPDRAYKALVLGLADALNATMPADAKAGAVSVESQMWEGTRPGPGQMRTIGELAMAPERRGEALLLILNTLQDKGLHDLSPDVTMEFVRQLVAMNQPASARALAIEALAQYRPPPLPNPPPKSAAAR